MTPTRLLFIRTDRLGETLLTLPAVNALARAFPRARLTLLVRPELADLMRQAPGVAEVMTEMARGGAPWWLRAIELARAIRRGRFDLAVVSNPRKDVHLAVWLAGIPTRVGYDRKWGGLLTHRIPDDKHLGERHEVEYNMGLLAPLGISHSPTPPLQLPVPASAVRRCTQLFEELRVSESDRLVAVHPWTSNPRKQWPVERFRDLVRVLAERPGVRPVLIGGPQERRGVSDVMEGSAAGVIDLVGRLSVTELAAMLRRVRVLVTSDSGPMHVAAAVGTPVVALFGTADPGSHPRRWGPWGDGHAVIHKPLEQIAVEEVMGSVQRYV